MSGLQNFLAPFSHLLFLNRNIDIIVLCFVVFVVTIIALQNYWRTTRLERELASARSSLSTSPAGRRYASTPTAPEAAPQETGGALPPIKGGRTYARNLGSALQKAGMSQPIYSPPTPAGWSPQQNPGQPGVGQPGIPQPPFAAPNVPWASTPPTPAPIPWAFPGGAGRNVQGPPPSPAPFFPPPQPTPAQMSPGMSQPPSGPAPSVYSPPPPGAGAFPPPPPMTGPFAAPQFTPPASGPLPAPAFPPAMNPMVQPVPPAAPPDEGSDAARRGKPKRRRFNFNVLENLEKMVQPKPSEPIPSTSWTPPAQPAAPPAAPAQTPAQATFSAIPQAPTASSPATPSVAPPATPLSEPTEKQPAAAPLPSFLFGKHGPPEPEQTKAPEPAVTEPVLDFAAPAAAETAAAHTEETAAAHTDETAASHTEETATVEPETSATPAPAEQETVAAPEAKPDIQRSMRSMMFGEEASAPAPSPARPEEPVADAQPAPEAPAAAEPKAEDTGEAWPSYPWNRREEASSSSESEAIEPAAPASEETVAESDHDTEPATDVTPAEQHDPWRADAVAEPEAWRSSTDTDTNTEAAPADAAQPTVAEAGADASTESSEPPVAGGGEKSGSGTIVIIEDDQAAASYYATLFRGNGYQVEVANDGVSGVDLCTRVQPQVILLDVMMPRQNGILVLQTLRASDETKSTPVVVMSNFSEPTLIKRAIQLGALEYVIKTQVEGPALLNAVPRWMNREKAFAAA